MIIMKDYLTPNPFSRPGKKLEKVTKIAVHYTANPGSTAENNRDYFESLKTGRRDGNGKLLYVSSHYVIGLEGEIIQCIPEDEWSYCTNQANKYSISIECCHKDSTGRFNEKTLFSLVELLADLCRRHKLNPVEDIIRHYDVTRKLCPKWYVEHPSDWTALRERVRKTMIGTNGYWVRVGAFSQKSRADEVAKKVTAIGFYNAVKEIEGKYYVEIGSFGNQVKASALAFLLTEDLYSYVVQK